MAPLPGFIGATYQSMSPAADAEDTINWIPAIEESPGAEARVVFDPSPGLDEFCTLADSPVRGVALAPGGRVFFCAGAKVYEVFADGTSAERGTVSEDSNPASMSASQVQLFVVSAGLCYCMDFATNTFAAVASTTGSGVFNIQASPDGLALAYTSVGVTGASESGTNVTMMVNQGLPHWVRPGDVVVVSGVTPAGYNGTFVLTDAAPRRIGYIGPAGLANAAHGGTVKLYHILINIQQDVDAFTPSQNVVTVAGAGVANYNTTWTVAKSVKIATSGHYYYQIICHASAAIVAAAPAASGNGTMAQAASDPMAALMVGFDDTYFLRILIGGQKWAISGLLDGVNWDPLDVSQISTVADNVISMIVDHREVWLFCETKTVVYQDTGAVFPFEPISSGFIEQGCTAAFSPCRLDNSIFWLGQDERGGSVAWRAKGYTPDRVSTHAIEYAWAQYSIVSDVVSWTYELNGHAFWVLQFPTANATWVYDASTQMWHKRSYWNLTTGTDDAHLGICHVYAFGKHLVGARNSGKIYEMSDAYYDDAGNPIRRKRVSPPIGDGTKWIPWNELQLLMEPGLGPIPPLASAPSVGSGPGSFILQSPDTTKWTVTITDGGVLTTAAGATGTPAAILINDNTTAAGTKTFQLVISNAGTVSASEVAFAISVPQSYPMVTAVTAYATGLTVSSAGAVSVIDPSTGGRGPIAMLRWSDTNGKTWSNSHELDCGQGGEYQKRIRLARLGRSRKRVIELTCTDPVPWRLIGADLNPER